MAGGDELIAMMKQRFDDCQVINLMLAREAFYDERQKNGKLGFILASDQWLPLGAEEVPVHISSGKGWRATLVVYAA